MKRISLFAIPVLVALLCAPVLAQGQEAKEAAPAQKQAQQEVHNRAFELLDLVVKEIPTLRLPENRIGVQATAADLLWKHDEKRARALIRQAIEDFAALAVEADEDERTSVEGFAVSVGQRSSPDYSSMAQARRFQLRQEILQLLARHDPKMAREFLRKTARPGNNPHPGEQDQDTESELQIAVQIAATDPKQATQIAQESVRKSYAYGVSAVLAELQKSDKDAAAALTAAILQRLRGEDLAANSQAAGWAFTFIGAALGDADDDDDDDQPKTVQTSESALFDEKSMRELVDMIASAALKQAANHKSGPDEDREQGAYLILGIGRAMPMVEKYAPSRVAAIKSALADLDKTADPQQKAYRDYQAVAQKGDYKAALEAAEKAPPEIRGVLAMEAAFKAASQGDVDRAREIINGMPDPSQRKGMLAQVDLLALQSAAQKNKLDDARPLLARLSTLDRAATLVEFAEGAAARKDNKQALALLDEARGLIPAQATNHAELQTLLQIARASAAIDASRSFDIVEPAIDQLNPLLSALAVLEGYEYSQCFKDGELISGQSPSAVLNAALQCVSELGLLSGSDFARARAAADRFSRADLRMMARLAVAGGVLSDGQAVVSGPNLVVRRFYDSRYR